MKFNYVFKDGRSASIDMAIANHGNRKRVEIKLAGTNMYESNNAVVITNNDARSILDATRLSFTKLSTMTYDDMLGSTLIVDLE